MVFFYVDRVRLCLELGPPMGLFFIPHDMWVWRATVELYWQGKTEELGENPVPVPLCPVQSPQRLTWARTRDSAVRGRRPTAWAMALPAMVLKEILITQILHIE
jgi:hypothetical protein